MVNNNGNLKYQPLPDHVDPLDYFKPSALPSPYDPKDHPLLPRALSPQEEQAIINTLPDEAYVNDPFVIVNQGPKGSCLGCAVARQVGIVCHLHGINFNASEEYCYDRAREEPYLNTLREDGFCEDSGSQPRDMMKVCQEGLLDDSQKPYTYGFCNHTTQQERELAARTLKIGEYAVAGSIAGVMQALASGLPVVSCYILMRNFQPDQNGNIPLPKVSEGMWGGHAMLFTGYNKHRFGTNRLGLLDANSWSTNWGYNGYCWIREAHARLPVDQGGLWIDDTFVIKAIAQQQQQPTELVTIKATHRVWTGFNHDTQQWETQEHTQELQVPHGAWIDSIVTNDKTGVQQIPFFNSDQEQ